MTNLLLFSCVRIHDNELNSVNYNNDLPYTKGQEAKTFDNITFNDEQLTQYDFCRCVIASDSIKKLIQEISDFETNYADQLLEQLEYIRNNCRSIVKPIAQKNNKEEQREYIEKIKNCLQDTAIRDIDLTFFN